MKLKNSENGYKRKLKTAKYEKGNQSTENIYIRPNVKSLVTSKGQCYNCISICMFVKCEPSWTSQLCLVPSVSSLHQLVHSKVI